MRGAQFGAGQELVRLADIEQFVDGGGVIAKLLVRIVRRGLKIGRVDVLSAGVAGDAQRGIGRLQGFSWNDM